MVKLNFDLIGLGATYGISTVHFFVCHEGVTSSTAYGPFLSLPCLLATVKWALLFCHALPPGCSSLGASWSRTESSETVGQIQPLLFWVMGVGYFDLETKSWLIQMFYTHSSLSSLLHPGEGLHRSLLISYYMFNCVLKFASWKLTDTMFYLLQKFHIDEIYRYRGYIDIFLIWIDLGTSVLNTISLKIYFH